MDPHSLCRSNDTVNDQVSNVQDGCMEPVVLGSPSGELLGMSESPQEAEAEASFQDARLSPPRPPTPVDVECSGFQVDEAAPLQGTLQQEQVCEPRQDVCAQAVEPWTPRTHSRVPSTGSCNSRGSLNTVSTTVSTVSTVRKHKRVPSTTSTTSTIEVTMEGDLEHQMRRWTSDSTHEQLIQQLYDEDEIGSDTPTWEDRESQCESELNDKYKETSWESIEREEDVPDATAVTPVASTRPHLRQCDKVKAFFQRAFLCLDRRRGD